MIAATVREAARRFGERIALSAAGGEAVSYRALDQRSDEFAAGLAARGVRAGDVVALALPSGVEYVVAYVSAAKLGAITAGVNPRLTAHERARLIALARPRLVVAEAGLDDRLPHDVAVASPSDLARAGAGATPLPIAEDGERAVAIVFTSGSTGEPRGAVFCNRQLRAVQAMDHGDTWRGGTAMLASTEFAHVGFMTKLPWHLRSGATIHMLGHWRARDALAVIARHRITSVGGIPAQISLMLREPSFDSFDLSCVSAVIAGGGLSSPALVREARRRFGARFSVRYSSTESGGLGTLTALDAPDDEALHTVGRSRPGVTLEIRDEDARPTKDVGEVWIRSEAVMSSYWRDPDATKQTLVDGWLRTGDLGLIDSDDCLRLAGRRKEMFVRGGYNVYPMEIEAVLSEHELIADVAIVPRADDVMGEIGVAVIVPADAARAPTLADVRAYAAARLARHKLPEAIRITDALPLNAMHKLDRKRLANEESALTPRRT